MRRIQTSSRALNLFGAGKDGFRDGDRSQGIAATAFNAEWANAVQEELLAVIEAAGLAPSAENVHQLLAAFNAMKGGLTGIQVFQASGTYTPTAGTASIVVEVVGGGGGGGGVGATGGTQGAGSAGGGGGGFGLARIAAAPASVAVTVGAGGAGGAAGNSYGSAGGTSSFGSYITASGGGGGTGCAARSSWPFFTRGGPGGSSSGTGILCFGQAGGNAMMPDAMNILAGIGGASRLGGGSAYAGNVRGAGGGGRANGPDQAATAGQDGAAGIVIVWEYK